MLHFVFLRLFFYCLSFRLGESCSLLFKIEDAVRNGYTTVACTDQAYQWNQCFVKKIQPSRISKIKFYKQEAKDRLKSSKRKKKRYTPATEIQQKQYVQELHEIAKSEKSLPVGWSLFKETYSVFSFPASVSAVKCLPMSMQSLHSDKYSKMSSEELKSECEKVKDSLKVTEAEVSYLSDSTVKQSSSSLWHEQRTGRLTASVAHSVIHTKVDAPAPSVIKNMCYPDNRILNVPAILWGREREHVAFKAYKEVVSSLHSDCKGCVGTQVARDHDFISELVLKIEKFWLKYCLPELLTHRKLETSKCTPDRITVVDTVHCFCGQPDNESVGMIGCDSDTCKYKWFHFPCVKIK